MIASDYRPDSNRSAFLKSVSTDVIISNHGSISVGFFSKLCPFHILRSMPTKISQLKIEIKDNNSII